MTSIKSLICLLICFLMPAFCSCIGDDLINCEVYITLSYTYNLSSEERFNTEAGKAILYLFDKDGLLLSMYPTSFDYINPNRITIDPLSRGLYKAVVSVQGPNSDNSMSDFDSSELVVGQSTITDLSYLMRRENGVQQSALNSFLLGSEEFEYTNQTDLEISLKKVTKKIHLILDSSLDDVKLEASDFDIWISDDKGNGHVSYDYSLLADESIRYKPYKSFYSGETKSIDYSSLQFELNTSRLLVSHDPKLTIVDLLNGTTVFNKSLIDLLSLLQVESGYTQFSLQEYLDRLDDVEIRIPVNTNFGSLITRIYINGWVINLVDIDV